MSLKARRKKNLVFCILNKNKFDRITTCDFDYGTWHVLEVTHMGNRKVKETKMNLLIKDIENFFLKQNAPIVDKITHFTNITNGLTCFDRKFIKGKLDSNMLRSLSNDWSSLRMLIESIKDINTNSLEELYRILMTYELNHAKTKGKKKTRKVKKRKWSTKLL